MNPLLRILLLAALAGPSVGQVLHPVQEACSEGQQDCCGDDNRCDVYCVQCVCCATVVIVFTGSVSSDDGNSPPARSAPVQVQAPPSAPRSDILHIPKSI